MSKKNGFTLIEILFVLGIISILLLLSTPFHSSRLEEQRDKQFLETLEFDILYIQNLATTAGNGQFVGITFQGNQYKISRGSKPAQFRSYPPGWIFQQVNGFDISFNNNGTIVGPRTIKIHSRTTSYHIIFPLGKGRCYIVEI